MTDLEKERLGLVLEKLNWVNSLIKSKNWDLSKVELEPNLRNYIMSDDYLVQVNVIHDETTRQLSVFKYACDISRKIILSGGTNMI